MAFGSINSGLGTETDARHLTDLWTRGNWLAYFFFMTFALILLFTFASQLDQVLAARSDLNAEPFAGMRARAGGLVPPATLGGRLVAFWDNAMMWTREKLELWTAPHDDKRIAWTLGIGWACCGGGLAGACLVFAKAAYVLCAYDISASSGWLIVRPLQRQAYFWSSVTREHREPVWARVCHLHLHLPY